MHRFNYLIDHIYRGVTLPESTTQTRASTHSEPIMIFEWSPNNVRRLVIGFEFAFIQHYVTSTKTQKKIDRVDLRSGIQRDLDLLNQGGKEYRPIIEAITAKRVLSSIEELVFLTPNYPKPLLRLDSNISLLETKEKRLETRFPRLRHISYVNCSYETLVVLLERSKGEKDLLLDVLQDAGVPVRTIAEPHKDDWWSGSALRPKHYNMDKLVLSKYFERVKEVMGEELKELQKEELDLNRNKELIETHAPDLNELLTSFRNLMYKGFEVFNASSIVSKSEWSNVLQDKSQYRALRFRIHSAAQKSNTDPTKTTNELLTSIRKIDYGGILRALEISEYRDANLLKERIEDFVGLMFNNVLSEDAYKRESNKLDLVNSLITFKKIGVILLRTEVNIVYLALVQYLSRNTPRYAYFFYQMIEDHLPTLTYTRTIVEFINKHHEEGVAKKAFDAIGAKEVLEEQFKLGARYEEALKILDALSKVTKS